MDTFQLIILSGIICIALLVTIILSGVYTKFKSNKKGVDVSKEFEIETRVNIRFLFMTGGLILPILVFLGWSSIQDVKDNLTKEVEEDMSENQIKITNLQDSIKFLSEVVNESTNNMRMLLNQADYINSKLKKSELSSKSLENKLEVQRAKIGKLEGVYFIEPIEFIEGRDYPAIRTYYYKDLKTNSGDSLPTFISEPRIMQLNSTFTAFNYVLRNESFDVQIDKPYHSPSGYDYIQFVIFY